MQAIKRSTPPPPESAPMPTVSAAKGQTPSKFTIRKLQPGEAGLKVCLYGPPGSGKSTLASLAPNPVFLDLNKGLWAGLSVVEADIRTFDDLRQIIAQAASAVPEGGSFVIDTVTEVDELMTEHLKTKYDKKSVKELSYDRFSCAVEA